MKTAWLKKYPKRPGAERFNAFYVFVEVVAEEERVVEYMHRETVETPAPPGVFTSTGMVYEHGPWEKRTRTEKWVQVRERGRLKWVEAKNVFDKHPHGYDPSVTATCRSKRV